MNIYKIKGDQDKASFWFRGVCGYPPFGFEFLDCQIEDRDPDPLSRVKFARTFPRYETVTPHLERPECLDALTFPKFEIGVEPPKDNNGKNLRKPPLFLDSHSIYSHPSGFNSCVSQRFVECMAPHLEGQCEFVPVEVEGAPTPYFILWVTRILDALDEELTIFTKPREDGRRVIVKAKFNEQIVGDSLLFRLPGRRYFAQDSDYATAPFIELCQRYELTGLEFMEDYTVEFIATSKKPARKK